MSKKYQAIKFRCGAVIVGSSAQHAHHQLYQTRRHLGERKNEFGHRQNPGHFHVNTLAQHSFFSLGRSRFASVLKKVSRCLNAIQQFCKTRLTSNQTIAPALLQSNHKYCNKSNLNWHSFHVTL